MDTPPPHFPDLAWRSVSATDLSALAGLAHACLLADGGLPFLFEPEYLQDRYFPPAPAKTYATGLFDSQGQLVACAAVHTSPNTAPSRLILLGFVHPGLRRQGLGGALLRWSLAQASAILPSAAESRPTLQIQTESLTPAAERLYQAHGFERVFAELVMQRDFDLPLPDRFLPDGLTLAEWEPELAKAFYQAYYDAFQERPGFPGWSAAEWIEHVNDTDLRPAWSLLARQSEEPAGFVIGDIDLTANPPAGYIWQVGVVRSYRRRGLASALLVESMRRMQQDGVRHAQLTVHLNNPGAIEAYTRLDFRVIGCRARYERSLQERARDEVRS